MLRTTAVDGAPEASENSPSSAVVATPPPTAGPAPPHFLADMHGEKVWDVVLALTTELAATRARLDSLERLLVQQGSLPPRAIEDWQPTVEDGVARAQDLQCYTQRVFESLGRG